MVSGSLDGGRMRKQFRGAAHREARAFAKTLTDPTIVYAARTRVGGRQVTRHFDRKIDAETWLAGQHLDKQRGECQPLEGGDRHGRGLRATVPGAAPGQSGRKHRRPLRALVRQTHSPGPGATAVGSLTPAAVEAWFGELQGRAACTAAKAYRLLRQIMNSAVEDRLRIANPCRIKDGGREPEAPRPAVSVSEVAALAEAMPANLGLAVLLACWMSLRRGEILGLQRGDIDVGAGTVTIRRTKVITVKNTVVVNEPRGRAGQRVLHIPPHILPVVQTHLDHQVGVAGDDPVFVCTRQEFHVAWQRARRSIGLEDLHFQDLRAAGFTLAARAGATVAEIMHRAGHSTPATARRYQRTQAERDRVLAAAMAQLAQASEPSPTSP